MADHEIEVFRADTRASRGITAENIAEVATTFSGSMPICFGHPKSDTPAAGTVKALRAAGSSLFATIGELTSKAVEGIKSGEWRAPSMAFFDPGHEANPTPGKWAGRHLALLGAAAPGIPGLTVPKSLAFSADDELTMDGPPADAVVFAAKPTPVHYVFDNEEPSMSGNTPTPTPTPSPSGEPTAAELLFKAREDAFAARIKTQFEASNGSAIDALVAAGKVLPAEAADLKLAFNALDPEAEELTFGAGDKATKATAASKLLAFMATALPKRVPLDTRLSPSHQFQADPALKPSSMTTAAADAGTLTARANELMKANPALTFDAAIEQVSGGGNLDA